MNLNTNNPGLSIKDQIQLHFNATQKINSNDDKINQYFNNNNTENKSNCTPQNFNRLSNNLNVNFQNTDS